MEKPEPSRLRFLDVEGLAEVAGRNRRTIYRLVARGEIPKPIRLGGRFIWPESALLAWAEKRFEEANLQHADPAGDSP